MRWLRTSPSPSIIIVDVIINVVVIDDILMMLLIRRKSSTTLEEHFIIFQFQTLFALHEIFEILLKNYSRCCWSFTQNFNNFTQIFSPSSVCNYWFYLHVKLHDHINLLKNSEGREKYSFTFVSLVNDFIFSFTLLFAHQTFFSGLFFLLKCKVDEISNWWIPLDSFAYKISTMIFIKYL